METLNPKTLTLNPKYMSTYNLHGELGGPVSTVIIGGFKYPEPPSRA